MSRLSRRPLGPMTALCLYLVLGLAVSAPAFLGFGSGPQTVTATDGRVTLPAADLADGKARHYVLNQGGTDIRFFLVKSPDGRIRAAFDACDVCYPENKGYKQDGEAMVCVNCGRRFHTSKVGEVHGGCNPAPLAVTVSGADVVIGLADLAAGTGYFTSGGVTGGPRS